MSGYSWIDENWSRDWLFWVGFALAGTSVVLLIALTDASAWSVVLSGLGTFGFTVAAIGFARTMTRAYRDEG